MKFRVSALLILTCCSTTTWAAPVGAAAGVDVGARLSAIEARTGGRLGLAALDTGSGRRIGQRASERFAMCSTFKWVLAAAVLSGVDRGELSLGRPVAFTAADLLDYAPVTRARVAEGSMTVSELCKAAIQVSDNTAANLLLSLVGGPAGVTTFLRRVGDPTTRLDRDEPTVNTNLPGDPRDTTTPDAMVATMKAILLGNALSASARAQLVEWMLGTETGRDRLHSGLPPDWRQGDKTGTCEHGATNDIAIVWPPGRAPILIAALLSESTHPLDERQAALAEVARVVAEAFSQSQ